MYNKKAFGIVGIDTVLAQQYTYIGRRRAEWSMVSGTLYLCSDRIDALMVAPAAVFCRLR